MREERKKISDNTHISLFSEVDGLCPKCSKPLMVNNRSKKVKLYEVAHIYPFSPRPEEMELLKSEIRLSDDVNSEENLIALCRDCHKLFDTPRTIDGYRELCEIKKQLRKTSRIKQEQCDYRIEEDIKDIIQRMLVFEPTETDKLSYTAMKVDEKISSDSPAVFRMKVNNQVTYFYPEIKDLFQQVDQRTPGTSDLIFNQVRTYYFKLKRDGFSQPDIFNLLVDWIKTTTKANNRESVETLVSFFVQNCEIFS